MATHYNNVILFGAGASADAGIPMLDSFVDKMWEYATRGKVGDKVISNEDREILIEANQIRIDLEKYGMRAFFDNRNLEDILSLLSFEALADGERKKYEIMVKAVARTIELSCAFQYANQIPKEPQSGGLYHSFWQCLLEDQIRGALPALITFNYDLVFERTLWEYFHFLDIHNRDRRNRSVGLNYNYGIYNFTMRGERHRYDLGNLNFRDGEMAVFDWENEGEIKIPYLKLHGSLNWDRDIPNKAKTDSGDKLYPSTTPTMAVERPLILPPVFNKMDWLKINTVWEAALNVLRHAKNIIIVGYSLPKTDIYMQYFLKSAVGPNSDLQKIIVFDPVLYENSSRTTAMKQRYQECFSPQFSSRIIFEPSPYTFASKSAAWGKFHHFVETLRRNPKDLFFLSIEFHRVVFSGF
jgi:hypothetical protein